MSLFGVVEDAQVNQFTIYSNLSPVVVTRSKHSWR